MRCIPLDGLKGRGYNVIEFKNVSKEYTEGNPVLNNINLTVNDGELLVLLGNSGCGKTTLLKLINRLLELSSGDILINGTNINTVDAVELRRDIGYVIQQVGLFPHMTVKENIEIVGQIQDKPYDEIEKNTERVMDMIGLNLEEYLYRYPAQLSGGQQQRIGVARALAADPDILLMDEPFSSLDPISRTQLQDELQGIQSVLKKTIVFVTHDIAEAVKMADRICLLHKGHIEQLAAPKDILKTPKTDFVKDFIGASRFWRTPSLIAVEDIMTADVFPFTVDTSPQQVYDALQQDHVPMICVTDKDGKMIGKLTEKIMIRHFEDNGSLDKQMKKDFAYVYPETSLQEALQLMLDDDILYLPVLSKEKTPLGVVHVNDLMEVLNEQFI